MPFDRLVDVATLNTHLLDPAWLLVDCRHALADPDAGRRAFEAGHLPGAVFVSVDDDLSDHRSGRPGRHPLPDAEWFAQRLGQLGVGPDTQVVAYDAEGGMFAARLWWMLRWIGHTSCAVLDGGLPAWVAAGGKLESTAQARPSQILPIRPSVALSVETSQVLDNLGHQHWLVCDARAPDRFRGENETIDPYAGHIPGARNRFYKDNLQSDGRFKPAHALKTEFTQWLGGITPEQVIHQCGSGITACHNLLAMEIAGLHGAKLYPGSWSEWVSDPSRPIALG